MTRVFESNGPDIKIRGTASHVAEKYVQLARDARSSGDPVAAENYYQHAEHYFRLIAAAQEQFRQNQPQPRTENEMPSPRKARTRARASRISARSPASSRQQPQPFVPRENNQRDQPARLPAARGPAIATSRASSTAARTSRAARASSAAAISAATPAAAGDRRHGGVDRLPSFITGPQPQVNGAPAVSKAMAAANVSPRRRRRPHGPRPEGMPRRPTPGDDFNPGNE